MSLPAEVRAKYVSIIDSILEVSDLSVISEKRIRKGIQEKVEYDITPQKAAISSLIMERFDIFNAKQSRDADPVPSVEVADPPPKTNGYHKEPKKSPSTSATPAKREADSEGLSDVVDVAPPKKKRKASVENDAALAARLQAEEDKLARPTRGGSSRKTATSKKKKRSPKKKTSARITGSDDSDVDDDDAEAKPKRDTGFHKPLNLSPALSNLFGGETQLSRPQTTKRIWQYIKGNDLQDPSDKRFIVCDEKLRDIFRQDKVHMFTMTKLLNQQLYNPDE